MGVSCQEGFLKKAVGPGSAGKETACCKGFRKQAGLGMRAAAAWGLPGAWHGQGADTGLGRDQRGWRASWGWGLGGGNRAPKKSERQP